MKGDSERWSELSLSKNIPMEILLESLPSQAAIYSFEHDFRLDSFFQEVKNEDDWCDLILSRINDVLSLSHGISRKVKVGAYESLEVTYSGSTKGSYLTKETLLSVIDVDEGFPAKLIDFINSLSSISPSLYIGETKCLKARVKQHLGSESSLSIRLKAEGIDFDRLKVRYLVLEDELYEEGDESSDDIETETIDFFGLDLDSNKKKEEINLPLKIFEEIATRYTKPRFVNKIGEQQI
ncbi:hypothetical protein [Vibrio sp. OPT18]|uniref:hypothetical protein n=1 Tax=Vibrio sp. OPT18 TaxID=2778641 RepID=UPI001880B9CD|nr:hypothetical protein [Vibrio sp. OPT18]MBE8576438.1 hypothetical protein [Vibrio sp. OPT18]